MADSTFAFVGRLMNIAFPHSEGCRIMARVTEFGPFLDQTQYPHQTVRLMTGQAFFALKRPMFVGTLEFIDRMTIDAVAFRRMELRLSNRPNILGTPGA